jgi:hypothetical protein
MIMSKREGRVVVYEMAPKSDIRVCVSIRVSVWVRIRCGVRVRFSIVANGCFLFFYVLMILKTGGHLENLHLVHIQGLNPEIQ